MGHSQQRPHWTTSGVPKTFQSSKDLRWTVSESAAPLSWPSKTDRVYVRQQGQNHHSPGCWMWWIFVLSHGQASFERTFSINKELTVENQKFVSNCKRKEKHLCWRLKNWLMRSLQKWKSKPCVFVVCFSFLVSCVSVQSIITSHSFAAFYFNFPPCMFELLPSSCLYRTLRMTVLTRTIGNDLWPGWAQSK